MQSNFFYKDVFLEKKNSKLLSRLKKKTNFFKYIFFVKMFFKLTWYAILNQNSKKVAMSRFRKIDFSKKNFKVVFF